jgi:hypothetical protein
MDRILANLHPGEHGPSKWSPTDEVLALLRMLLPNERASETEKNSDGVLVRPSLDSAVRGLPEDFALVCFRQPQADSSRT